MAVAELPDTREPSAEWTVATRDAREFYNKDGVSILLSRWREPWAGMIARGELQVEFRTVVNRIDPRNRWWWRLTPPPFADAGPLFAAAPPPGPRRLRGREP